MTNSTLVDKSYYYRNYAYIYVHILYLTFMKVHITTVKMLVVLMAMMFF